MHNARATIPKMASERERVVRLRARLPWQMFAEVREREQQLGGLDRFRHVHVEAPGIPMSETTRSTRSNWMAASASLALAASCPLTSQDSSTTRSKSRASSSSLTTSTLSRIARYPATGRSAYRPACSPKPQAPQYAHHPKPVHEHPIAKNARRTKIRHATTNLGSAVPAGRLSGARQMLALRACDEAASALG